MILCCAYCEEPIPAGWDSDMFCSEYCEDEFEFALWADVTGDDQ